jgi:hypothetical protein
VRALRPYDGGGYIEKVSPTLGFSAVEGKALVSEEQTQKESEEKKYSRWSESFGKT